MPKIPVILIKVMLPYLAISIAKCDNNPSFNLYCLNGLYAYNEPSFLDLGYFQFDSFTQNSFQKILYFILKT